MSANHYRQLLEGATNLLIEHIKANIGVELDTVGAAVGLPQVSLENPVQYFIYTKPHAYKLPAIFVIADEQDFRIQEQKANFINAKDKFKISALVEDQTEDNLTYKCFRYLSALHAVLDEADIASQDGKLALTVIVYRAGFSDIFERDAKSTEGGKFRKAIILECEIEHNENF